MRIWILFDIKDKPWGGGNQFLRALRDEFRARGLYAENAAESDVILFNSYQNLIEAIKFKIKYPQKIFIHRLGPIFSLHRGNRWKIMDKLVIRVANLIADKVIFQSAWSLERAAKMGFDVKNPHGIILNGADKAIFNSGGRKQPAIASDKVKLVATSWSSNFNKGFEIYKFLDENLDFSRYEMSFVGNSPVTFKNIKNLGVLSSDKLAEELKKYDIFISAVKDDACSNSIIEASACGLPIVALNSGGNREIVKTGGELFADIGDIIQKIELIRQNYSKYVSDDYDISKTAEKYILEINNVRKNFNKRRGVALLYLYAAWILFFFKLRNKLF